MDFVGEVSVTVAAAELRHGDRGAQVAVSAETVSCGPFVRSEGFVASEVRLVADRAGVGVMCRAVVGKGSGVRKESIAFPAVQWE
jgi:hypothetical protein